MPKPHFIGAVIAALLSSPSLAQNAAVQTGYSDTSTTPAPAPVLPNWVGPRVGKPIDNACYRKSYITTNKKCATGYNFDNMLTCWTQCPIEYPVECGMECIQQNKDCTKEILTKASSVVNAVLNTATAGVFGEFTKAAKNVQTGVHCGQQLFGVVNKVVSYSNEVESGKTDTTKDKLLFLLNKTDFVVYDLPVAVATCLGKPVPDVANKSKEIVDVAQAFVNMIVNKKLSGANLLDFSTFLNATKEDVPVVYKPVSSLSDSDAAHLKMLANSNVTCGKDIHSAMNKIVAAVQSLKTLAPSSPMDIIKFAVLNSDLVLKELPTTVDKCVNSTGFSSRDDILKTVHTIIDRVVEASSQNGNPVSTADYAITITNMGLDAIALFDPTGIAAMASEFVQPICGPTVYVGDIDSGPADQALGLNTIEKAFRNSTGTWTKGGDGQLRLNFKSLDTEDITVNVLSGGQKVYEIPVKKGQQVTWTKPLAEFQGKTLYLDRWRPGFLGIAGTGGGSALAWVPSNSGGLELNLQVNPTSFSDKALRN